MDEEEHRFEEGVPCGSYGFYGAIKEHVQRATFGSR